MARQDRNSEKARSTVVPVNMVRPALGAYKIKRRILDGMFYLQRRRFIFFIIQQNLVGSFKVFLKYLQLDAADRLGQQPVRLDELFVRNKAVDATLGQDLFVPVRLKRRFVEFEFYQFVHLLKFA